jgi:hypothetical protein
MEMGWLETVAFIGLDLQVGLVLALLGLHVLEHALHSAWSAFSGFLRGARIRVHRPASPWARSSGSGTVGSAIDRAS